MNTRTDSRRKSRRILAVSAMVLVAAMLVPLTGYVYVAVAQKQAESPAAWSETNPRSETWREVRQGNEGYSAVKGPEANVLINNGGQIYRQIRNGPVSIYGPWVLAIMLLGIVGMFVLSGGGQKVEKPLSGKRVPRWGAYDRYVHWIMSITFIVLAITGLSLLFGRAVLIPLLGAEGFAAWAYAAKYIHNYSGPLFAVTLIMLVISMARHNIPSRVDVDWFLKGGFAGKHVPTGKLNAGEKLWFWFNGIAGIAVALSGIVLILPNVFETRSLMQIMLLLHAGLALLYIGGSFIHMYMGTLGARGALDGMTKGHVSSEWAEQHHDLWYAQVKSEGKEFVEDDQASSGSRGVNSESGSTA
ncbi:MAG: formate dehydrogenase subunit gamma [Wenzhouxiangella sp.]